MLAVGRADRPEPSELPALHFLQRAVVREDPMPAPELATDRVRVRERLRAARAASDMADREQGLDRIVGEETRERALGGGARLEEYARGSTFVEREAPSVAVRSGLAAALS